MLAYYRNFYPNIVKMKALMDEGPIGESITPVSMIRIGMIYIVGGWTPKSAVF